MLRVHCRWKVREYRSLEDSGKEREFNKLDCRKQTVKCPGMVL